MFRLKGENTGKRLLIGKGCLTGQGRHQINIDIRKSGVPRGSIIFLKLFKGMNPSQCGQFFVIGGLKTDAQAIDAHAAHGSKQIFSQRAGVAFNGNFGVSAQRRISDGIHQA